MENRVSKGKQAKRRRYNPEFKREAVRRMANCESVVGLARELGIHWILLYKWKRAEQAAAAKQEADSVERREAALREEIQRLKSALADRTLEIDFFKGALQRIETRRHNSES
jgi:transposase-like protein